jgi:hypothetical protein
MDEYEKYFYAICNTMVKFQEEYPYYFESITNKIDISETAFEKQPILIEIYKVGEEINQIIIDLLKRGITDNYFRKDLEPLTAMFVLWASICGIITMASQKEIYLKDKANINKREFLNSGFQMLLNSIR